MAMPAKGIRHPNGIISQIDAQIRASTTSEPERVMLLCMRDIYCQLCDHLISHDKWGAPARQMVWSLLTLLAGAVVMAAATKLF